MFKVYAHIFKTLAVLCIVVHHLENTILYLISHWPLKCKNLIKKVLVPGHIHVLSRILFHHPWMFICHGSITINCNFSTLFRCTEPKYKSTVLKIASAMVMIRRSLLQRHCSCMCLFGYELCMVCSFVIRYFFMHLPMALFYSCMFSNFSATDWSSTLTMSMAAGKRSSYVIVLQFLAFVVSYAVRCMEGRYVFRT